MMGLVLWLSILGTQCIGNEALSIGVYLALPDDDIADLDNRVSWTHASRTDKGVHAIAQVVSVKPRQHFDDQQLVKLINEKLPSDIR